MQFASLFNGIPEQLRMDATCHLNDVAEVVHRAYLLGYAAGVKEGGEKMRDAILQAAQLPTVAQNDEARFASHAVASSRSTATLASRAPRGAIRAAIQAAMRGRPEGISERELAEVIEMLDPKVSGRSTGGELRRMRNRLYRFDRGKWFPIAQLGKKETTEAAPAASVVSQPTPKEEPDGSDNAVAA